MSNKYYRNPGIDGLSGRAGGGESALMIVICIVFVLSVCVCVGVTCYAGIYIRQALCQGFNFGASTSNCNTRFP